MPARGRDVRGIVPNAQWLAQVREDAIEPELPIIDPHHHVGEYIARYSLDDLIADLSTGHHIVATVYVQWGYAYRQSGPEELKPVGETEFVVGVAEEAERRGSKTKICAGIVGTADLALGDKVADVLRAHLEIAGSRFKGIRHVTARHEGFKFGRMAEPPAGQMYDADFRKGFAQLGKLGLTFDAWLYHTQIAELADLARTYPDMGIVLDHVGGPLGVGPYRGKRDLVFREWEAAMKDLARRPNVHVKLVGLGMAVVGFDFHKEPKPPSSETLAAAGRPFIETAIELFGAERCMFESNFPIDKAMFGYAVVWNAFKRLASGSSATEKRALFHDNAARFYRLEDSL